MYNIVIRSGEVLWNETCNHYSSIIKLVESELDTIEKCRILIFDLLYPIFVSKTLTNGGMCGTLSLVDSLESVTDEFGFFKQHNVHVMKLLAKNRLFVKLEKRTYDGFTFKIYKNNPNSFRFTINNPFIPSPLSSGFLEVAVTPIKLIQQPATVSHIF